MEKRYIIERALKFNDKKKTRMPSMNGDFVKDKELFYDMGRVIANEIYEKDWEFNPLIPKYIGTDKKVPKISDFHGWLVNEPSIISYVISPRLKEILNTFNLYPNKFYNAKVLFKEKELPFFVWQLFIDGFDKFVDFEQSTFCEWGEEEKIGDEQLKLTNKRDLSTIRRQHKWRRCFFNKAVMKPEFKELDCVRLPPPLGNVISERLKNALEAVDPPLEGLEIHPCPVEFEYL